jgi:P4 family phage/plasmid primase-like protien
MAPIPTPTEVLQNIDRLKAVGIKDGSQWFNAWADYWRYVIGVNVVPADTRNKVTGTRWAEFQRSPITEEQHEKWKADNAFCNGMAIILGRVWHNPLRSEFHVNAVDGDNVVAVSEICCYNGKQLSVQELANWTLVEQHKDAPDKMHVIVYSKKPFLTKGSDRGNPKHSEMIDADKVPAIEVKSIGTMLFVTPSPHRNGYNYEIIGVKDPVICDEFEKHVDRICRKYGIKYLENDTGHGSSDIPTDELFEEDFTIYEGHNRHKALMRAAESMIRTNKGILSEEDIKYMADVWNEKHCKPPLDNDQFYEQWQDAKDFIAKKKRVEEERKSYYLKTAEEVEAMPLEEKIEYLLGSINGIHPKDMIDKYHFKCLIDTRELLYYDSFKGTYVENGEIVIEQELEANQVSFNKIYAKVGTIAALLSEDQIKNLKKAGIFPISTEKSWTRGSIDDFQGHIERYPGVFMDRNNFNPDIEWMAFNNCMVNLLTRETADFSHEFSNTTRIPVTYTGDVYSTGPIADFWNWVGDTTIITGPCPRIKKFLHEIMAAEDVELLLDFVAYCLWRDMPYHKWLILRGEGLNGKGTLLTLIRVFLGLENVAGESLTRLLENTWSTAQLYGRLANIDADISRESLKNTGLLKKLSGNDPIPAENKFQKPFWFSNYAKLILSANEIPETPDETDAFFRRPVIINMIDQFLGNRMDPHLIDKITTEDELSGFLYVLLERLPKVIEEGKRFVTNQESIAQNREKYMQGTHQVRAFANACLEFDPTRTEVGGNDNDKDVIYAPKNDVYDAYIRYCNYYHLTPSSESSLSRNLLKEFKYEWTGFGYKNIGGRKDRKLCWIGVKIKQFKPTEDDDQETLY